MNMKRKQQQQQIPRRETCHGKSSSDTALPVCSLHNRQLEEQQTHSSLLTLGSNVELKCSMELKVLARGCVPSYPILDIFNRISLVFCFGKQAWRDGLKDMSEISHNTADKIDVPEDEKSGITVYPRHR